MFDILIIGAGVHGSLLAARILRDRLCRSDYLALLDPFERPLARFEALSLATGMTHLRSPGSHNLSPDKSALIRWAKQKNGLETPFLGPQYRPATKLFFAHSQAYLKDMGIPQKIHQGWAKEIYPLQSINAGKRSQGWRVETEQGSLETKILILAPGSRETPLIPPWARKKEKITHVFSPYFSRLRPSPGETMAVVGGGISAHQLALTLSQKFPGCQTTLIRRKNPEIKPYDSDPAYLGPKKKNYFSLLTNPQDRRECIREARWAGSIPSDVMEAFNRALDKKTLCLLEKAIISVRESGKEGVRRDKEPFLGQEKRRKAPGFPKESPRASDANSSSTMSVLCFHDKQEQAFNHIILATGFVDDLPQRSWIARLISSENLPVHQDSYPLPSFFLQWAKNLYLSGGLAELELGPSGLNIIGAHKSYERIVQGILKG